MLSTAGLAKALGIPAKKIQLSLDRNGEFFGIRPTRPGRGLVAMAGRHTDQVGQPAVEQTIQLFEEFQMNAYRFAIRSRGGCYDDQYFTDLAISVPPLELEPLLLQHRLVPIGDRIAAVGRFNTDKEAKAAHDDLVLMVQLIDVFGLRIAADQSVIFRDRRLGQLFNAPLVLEDNNGTTFVLDKRPNDSHYNPQYPLAWRESDPVGRADWSICYVGRLSDGSHIRLSTRTGDLGPLINNSDTWHYPDLQ